MNRDEIEKESPAPSSEKKEWEAIDAELGRRIHCLSVKEVSILLHVTTKQIYRWCARVPPRIPFHRHGHELHFLEEEIKHPDVIQRIWHLLGRPKRLQTTLGLALPEN